MLKVLWLAGMTFGPLWGADNLSSPSDTQQGALSGATLGAGIGALAGGPKQLAGAAIGGAAGATDERPRFTPIPMQPWVADHIADRFERKDHRVPILPPIKVGERPTCDDPPDHAEILRAMPRVDRGVPYVYEMFRDDIEFTVEKLADRIDAPRFIPLIGPCQLHHCQWKCTVYFTETVDFLFPLPFRLKTRRAEVVHIDKDHFHLFGAPPAIADVAAPAPMACPAGFASKKETAKAESAVQVHLDVTIAQIDRTALPNATYRWAEKHFGLTGDGIAVSAVKNGAEFGEFLKAMRSDGFVEILCQPQIRTLSGQKATVQVGQLMPDPKSPAAFGSEIVFKHVGTKLDIRPTVLANGKIRFEVHPEFTTLGEPGDVSGLNRQAAQVTVDMAADGTLLIRGLTVQGTSTILTRVPVLSDFPVVGRLFVWRHSQESRKDRVIVVTPRIIRPWGDAEASQAPPAALPAPRELKMSPHEPDRFKPADFVHIEAKRLVPKGPHKLGPTDVLLVEILGSPTKHNIGGPYEISASGTIDFGGNLNFIRVAGGTLAEAQAVIEKRIEVRIWAPLAVYVTLDDCRGARHIRGQHLVRPDGTICLDIYGFVRVEGMTVGEVKIAVEKHLEEYFVKPQVSVDSRKTPLMPAWQPHQTFPEHSQPLPAVQTELQLPPPELLPPPVKENAITDMVTTWNGHITFTQDAANNNAKLPVLKGRLYLFAGDACADANGDVVVTMCDRESVKSGTPAKLAEWRITADILKKLKSNDGFGDGYTLFLPLVFDNVMGKKVEMQVTYHPTKGLPRSSNPARVTLQSDDAPNDETPIPTNEPAKQASKQMTLEEIVRLSKHAGTEDLIIRQIELTGSVFQPTTSEILSLLEQGVNPRVIRVMQERRAGVTIAEPRELRVNSLSAPK